MMLSTNTIFSLVSTIAAGQWLLLIVLPKWRVTQWLVTYSLVPLLLSVIYFVYIAGFFNANGGFGSIEELRSLFNNDKLLLAGWVHYLAFDLVVGFYLFRAAAAAKIAHWLLVPCLALTFFFGPLGLLLFNVINKIKHHHEVFFHPSKKA